MSAKPARKVELRPPLLTDAAELAAAVNESLETLRRRMRWARAPVSEAEAAAFFKKAFAEEAAGEAAHYLVVDAKTGAVAGMAALQKLKAQPGAGELSIWIRRSLQDKGYATAAGRQLLELALRERKLQRVWLRVDPANRSARRVAQKLGFKYEGRLRREKRLNNRWLDQECWGLLKEEWKA